MYLGLNCSGFTASACLAHTGRVVAAIAEERLSWLKRDRTFPHRAIQYCLDAANVTLADVEQVLIAWNPRAYIKKSTGSQLEAMQSRGKVAYLGLNELATLLDGEVLEVQEALVTHDQRVEIRFVDHHMAHLAYAYGLSGFEASDFLMLDGFGELTSGCCGSVAEGAVKKLRDYPTPHSLGSFYSAFTEYLGFRPASDEWKVMALSAMGDPERYYNDVRALVRVDGLGFELDLSYFEHYLFFKPGMFSQKLVERFGPARKLDAEPRQQDCDLVAAVQRVAEETVFAILSELQGQTGAKNLVVGGGFFMNSVCNGKLLEQTPYEHLHIGGAPDDSGTAVGAALYPVVLGKDRPKAPLPRQAHNYWGRSYSDAEIEAELLRCKLPYQRLDAPEETAADLLRAGKVIGWFQGGSEFGQRALGNRSILADPTRAEMKDAVNASVKYREGFRPFAGSVLREHQDAVLDMGGQDGCFMERVRPVRPEWRDRIPAVVHYDGSMRLQTVCQDVNPLFYRLIQAFHARSGVPLVLNTSFNVNGMPLVESPADALQCFYACGLDALILGPFLLTKRPLSFDVQHCGDEREARREGHPLDAAASA